MKVLITGSAGFQAKFVIEHLQAKHELTLFDIVEMQTPHRFIKGDITRYEDVEKACQGQDAVVHLVALVRGRQDKPIRTFADVMVTGAWHIAEACAKTRNPKSMQPSDLGSMFVQMAEMPSYIEIGEMVVNPLPR